MTELSIIDSELRSPTGGANPYVRDAIVRLYEQESSQGDSKMLNVLWCYRSIYLIQSLYYEAFRYLSRASAASDEINADGIDSEKSLLYEQAWCELVDCETLIQDLCRNYCINSSSLDDFRISVIWGDVRRLQLLFPYRYFLSEESVIKRRECSICGQTVSLSGGCSHVPGKVYTGRMCRFQVLEAQLKAVSIVENPQDKKCVLKLHGRPYTFDCLDAIVPRIGPYSVWKYTVERRMKPEYIGIGDADKCSCGSGLSFGECVRNDVERHSMLHVSIHLPKR